MADPQHRFLITGAGSGIGRALCRHFAQAGHEVVAADLRWEAVQESVAGTTARPIALDVRAPEGLDFPVDVLINNAGVQYVAPFGEFPEDKWAELVDVMLVGTARVTRAVLPGMQQRNFGRIVNFGSIHSLVASPFKSAYVAAKHGLLGFAKTLALETADADITVNTLCPSYVRTPLIAAQIATLAQRHGIDEEQVVDQIMLAPMPKKAFITYEELAGCIEFLTSPAARNITGQTLTIDGGWTAR